MDTVRLIIGLIIFQKACLDGLAQAPYNHMLHYSSQNITSFSKLLKEVSSVVPAQVRQVDYK